MQECHIQACMLDQLWLRTSQVKFYLTKLSVRIKSPVLGHELCFEQPPASIVTWTFICTQGSILGQYVIIFSAKENQVEANGKAALHVNEIFLYECAQ